MPKLFYILRYKALNYIYSSFGQIAERYSNVELPEYPNEMTKQFDNIMNSYLDIQEFNDILQQEVDRFCQRINSTRTFYLHKSEDRIILIGLYTFLRYILLSTSII